ncbi:hypothetical protein GQ44DRAFT_823783 [Phaeosphaeriaceae sp. PMI808]|nr:hypothetical protein GQ44DRAFT_823783 [Phaeosphaeriaceae sp. PMI808]
MTFSFKMPISLSISINLPPALKAPFRRLAKALTDPAPSLTLGATSLYWPGFTRRAFHVLSLAFFAAIVHFAIIAVLGTKLLQLEPTMSCRNNGILGAWTEELRPYPLTLIKFGEPARRFSMSESSGKGALIPLTLLNPSIILFLLSILLMHHRSSRGISNRAGLFSSAPIILLCILGATEDAWLDPSTRAPAKGKTYPPCWVAAQDYVDAESHMRTRVALGVAGQTCSVIAGGILLIYFCFAMLAAWRNYPAALLAWEAREREGRLERGSAVVMQVLPAEGATTRASREQGEGVENPFATLVQTRANTPACVQASASRTGNGPKKCYLCPAPAVGSSLSLSFPFSTRVVDEEAGEGSADSLGEDEVVKRDGEGKGSAE